jgi:hypothetical protein
MNLSALSKITGHSFCVGGASLKNALDIPIPEICSLGCWSSNCYKVYIRQYSHDEIKQAKSFINNPFLLCNAV